MTEGPTWGCRFHDEGVVMCSHPTCGEQATDERGGMPLCRGHFFLALTWEQPAPVEEATA